MSTVNDQALSDIGLPIVFRTLAEIKDAANYHNIPTEDLLKTVSEGLFPVAESYNITDGETAQQATEEVAGQEAAGTEGAEETEDLVIEESLSKLNEFLTQMAEKMRLENEAKRTELKGVVGISDWQDTSRECIRVYLYPGEAMAITHPESVEMRKSDKPGFQHDIRLGDGQQITIPAGWIAAFYRGHDDGQFKRIG